MSSAKGMATQKKKKKKKQESSPALAIDSFSLFCFSQSKPELGNGVCTL
jgi:hypothetical protein